MNSLLIEILWCLLILRLPNFQRWVVALVAAGGLAAALSTAAGLLLVISASVSHGSYEVCCMEKYASTCGIAYGYELLRPLR